MLCNLKPDDYQIVKLLRKPLFFFNIFFFEIYRDKIRSQTLDLSKTLLTVRDYQDEIN